MRPNFGVEIYMTIFTTLILIRKICLKHIQIRGNKSWSPCGPPPTSTWGANKKSTKNKSQGTNLWIPQLRIRFHQSDGRSDASLLQLIPEPEESLCHHRIRAWGGLAQQAVIFLLDANGVKRRGSVWCPHCTSQHEGTPWQGESPHRNQFGL